LAVKTYLLVFLWGLVRTWGPDTRGGWLSAGFAILGLRSCRLRLPAFPATALSIRSTTPH